MSEIQEYVVAIHMKAQLIERLCESSDSRCNLAAEIQQMASEVLLLISPKDAKSARSR